MLELLTLTFALVSEPVAEPCAETMYVEAGKATIFARVRERLGEPTYQHTRDARFTVGYSLPREPRCRHSARALEFEFGKDGKLLAKRLEGRADLPKEWLDRIRAGMSVDEAVVLLGEPEEIVELESGLTKLTYWVEKAGMHELFFDTAGKLIIDPSDCQ